MAKRPRYSRWRRLPGVFRFGETTRPDSNLEPQRLTLYLSWAELDHAEALAAQAGVATLQEYCTELLRKGLDAERVRAQVADLEAQRGVMEGLHEIADDPEYLAEWSAEVQAQAQARERAEPVRLDTPPERVVLPEAETSVPDDLAVNSQGAMPAAADAERSALAAALPVARLSPAAEVVLRHALQAGEEGPSLLANLRRGESAAIADVAELARALNELEKEVSEATLLDRRLAYALHRLAFEAQVLHTDAWPGAFDDWTVDTLRAVQEAVDRILSGQDIRYYAQRSSPEGSR